MRHDILRAVGPLPMAQDWQLEQAVDALVAESEMDADAYAVGHGLQDRIMMRAEALAILGHEMRRRKDNAD